MEFAKRKASGNLALSFHDHPLLNGFWNSNGISLNELREGGKELSAIGRMHLWCDIIRETSTALSISRRAAADIRVAAEILVREWAESRKVRRFIDKLRKNGAGASQALTQDLVTR